MKDEGTVLLPHLLPCSLRFLSNCLQYHQCPSSVTIRLCKANIRKEEENKLRLITTRTNNRQQNVNSNLDIIVDGHFGGDYSRIRWWLKVGRGRRQSDSQTMVRRHCCHLPPSGQVLDRETTKVPLSKGQSHELCNCFSAPAQARPLVSLARGEIHQGP